MAAISLEVAADRTGERLDRYLASVVPGQSRSQIQRLIEQGQVAVAGRTAKANLAVKAGDRITVDVPEPAPSTAVAEDIPLTIVYEDSDLVVVDKPAGMVVHPAAGHDSGTLVNALLHRIKDLSGIGGELRPGIVHRLDKGTSGLMVVAKNDRRPRIAVASVCRAGSREGIRRARLGRGAGGPPHRFADWTRSERPSEDVCALTPRAACRDANHARAGTIAA